MKSEVIPLMKLNYKKTICVGFAFFLISMFWQAYDTLVPKILTDKFGMAQTWSGAIMAMDNLIALFLLPLFKFDRAKKESEDHTEWHKKHLHISKQTNNN